jgi:hypothetical protein
MASQQPPTDSGKANARSDACIALIRPAAFPDAETLRTFPDVRVVDVSRLWFRSDQGAQGPAHVENCGIVHIDPATAYLDLAGPGLLGNASEL